MIKYLKRKNLNVEKYNACIENSLQSRIYAYSWYLDIVADNWDVLVLGDYDAVMPIPWKKKYCIKYISQPFFCQQLGVFSINEITDKLFVSFLKRIPKIFMKSNLQLNSLNNYRYKNIEEKENYVLSLDDDYSKIFKKFSKGRKHAIKVAEKLDLKVRKTSPINIFNFTKKYYPSIVLEQKQYNFLETLCVNFKESFEVLGVFNANDDLLGGVIFSRNKNRITYLFSSFSDDGKKSQAASYIINYIIKNNSNNNLILDFEGSSIKGIAKFYRSFNARLEPYFQYNYSKLFIH